MAEPADYRASTAGDVNKDKGLSRLSIATWDVSTASDTVFDRRKAVERPRWRTTFGSERRDRARTETSSLGVDADVLLIQGLRNIHQLRRLLPARTWRLVLSKDYVHALPRLGRLPDDLRAYDVAHVGRISERPLTAIAVRYQRGVRIRAVKHLATPAKADRPVNRSGLQSEAVAVKLNVKGKAVWLISAPSAGDCDGLQENCLAASAQIWRRKIASKLQRLVIGTASGKISGPLGDQPDDGKPACPQRLLWLQVDGGQIAPLKAIGTAKPKYGCLLQARLP